MPPDFGCQLQKGLAGVWKSGPQESQFGAAHSTLRIRRDCTYRLSVRIFLVLRLRGGGPIRSSEGTLFVHHPSGGVVTWRYRLEGDVLALEEGDPEARRYRRVADASCSEL